MTFQGWQSCASSGEALMHPDTTHCVGLLRAYAFKRVNVVGEVGSDGVLKALLGVGYRVARLDANHSRRGKRVKRHGQHTRHKLFG